MSRFAAVVVAFAILTGVAACGGDDDEGDGGGEDFVAQTDAICEEGAASVRDANLEFGYSTDEEDRLESAQLVLEAREQALSEFEALEPPAEVADDFEQYIAARKDLTAATEDEIAALEKSDQAGVEEAAATAAKAGEQLDKFAKAVDLNSCAGILPDDDAQAAEDVLHEFNTTADPVTSCDSDELVTEIYLEEGFGGVEACTKKQETIEVPKDVKVSEITGVDDVLANLQFEDVGGKFDGLPSTATLYYVDGGWKIFSIAEATE